MTKSIVVAIDENHAIGKANKLLCHLSNDLKNFKTITQGHTVIMGRKTFESLPNGALPKRRNIVITRNKSLQIEGVEVLTSLEDAFDACKDDREVFVIGGGSVYRDVFPVADKLYVTIIHHKFEDVDTHFPVIEPSEWEEVTEDNHGADEKNEYAHTFILYKRRSGK
ncbi:dihydrofolate reductase [Viscerimonas tarda]